MSLMYEFFIHYEKCQKRNLELEAQVNASGANANAHSLPASLAVQE